MEYGLLKYYINKPYSIILVLKYNINNVMWLINQFLYYAMHMNNHFISSNKIKKDCSESR